MQTLNVVFECELCNFRTNNYLEEWRPHLMHKNHQTRARDRTKTFTNADKERCCVVSGVRSVSWKDVFNFFSEKNVIADFVFWNELPNICLVQFLLPGSAAVVSATPGATKSILGKNISVRLRSKIPDAEWNSICPSAAPTSKKPTQPTSTKSSAASVPPASELNSSSPTKDKNSLPPPKKLFSSYKPFSNRNEEHTMELILSKHFKEKATDFLTSNSTRGRVKTFNVYSYFIEQIQQFNLLVWENLFGIELFSVELPESGYHETSAFQGPYQVGPLIRGILTHPRKIELWMRRGGQQHQVTWRHYKASYLNSLKRGLKPKPLKTWDENNPRTFPVSQNIQLSFDLKIVSLFKSCKIRQDSEGQRLVIRFKFANVEKACEPGSLQHLRDIGDMFQMLWTEFSLWKLQ